MASGIVPGKSVRRSLICVSREPSYYLLSIFSFPPSPTIHESFLHDSLRPSFCLVSRSLLACISGPLKIEESHRDTGRETNETRGNRLCQNAMSFLSLFLSLLPPRFFPRFVLLEPFLPSFFARTCPREEAGLFSFSRENFNSFSVRMKGGKPLFDLSTSFLEKIFPRFLHGNRRRNTRTRTCVCAFNRLFPEIPSCFRTSRRK